MSRLPAESGLYYDFHYPEIQALNKPSKRTSITIAGNVYPAALACLQSLGYVVSLEDDGILWRATNDSNKFIAEDPIQLLGLVKLHAERGDDWFPTDPEVESYLALGGAADEVSPNPTTSRGEVYFRLGGDVHIMTSTKHLASLVPATKYDTEKASTLVQLGFPAVESILPQILEWLQDRNWPVAHVFEPFLVRIGEPLAPYVRTVVAGRDDGWKYSLLVGVVAQSLALTRALLPELERIAANPGEGESMEEVDLIAAEILGGLGTGAPGAQGKFP